MKLFASDFDGTFFFGVENDVFTSNVNSVREFQKENKFAFVTGRSIQSILINLKNTDLKPDYIAGYNGGLIVDSKNQILFKDLPKINFEKLDKILKEEKVDFLSCMNDTQFYQKNYSFNLKNCFISWMYIHQSKLTKVRKMEHLDLDSLYMCTVSCKSVKHAKLVSERINELNMDCSAYVNNSFIDIVGKCSSKANAVEMISKHMNANEIYVIGDSYNDLSMIEKYQGFTLNHANDEIKIKSSNVFKTVKDAIESIISHE